MSRNEAIKRTIRAWRLGLPGQKAPKNQGQFNEALQILFNNLQQKHEVTREEFEGSLRKAIVDECHEKNFPTAKKWRARVDDRFADACISYLWPEILITELSEEELATKKATSINIKSEPTKEDRPPRKPKKSKSIEDREDFMSLDRSKLNPTGIEVSSDDLDKELNDL